MSFFSQMTVFTLALFLLCCKDRVDQVSSCGCDGQTITKLSQEEGQIEIQQLGGIRLFRIVNANKALRLSVCDSTTLSQASKINNVRVRFSGQVKESCTKPNEQPLYSPIQITQIAKL